MTNGSVGFGVVDEPWWDDRPVFIVGGGPSLIGRDLSRLRQRGWVLGVNRAADLVPVDATFSLDAVFIRRRADDLAKWAETQQVYLGMPASYPGPFIPGAIYLDRIRGAGLSRNPGRVINGLNSGYSALNVAALKRAREIFLLGYDMVPTPRDGLSHWHGGYPWQERSSETYYRRWADLFKGAAAELPAGVKVWNCNPASSVRAFPFSSYEAIGL
jgi:hypothetical protein